MKGIKYLYYNKRKFYENINVPFLTLLSILFYDQLLSKLHHKHPFPWTLITQIYEEYVPQPNNVHHPC